MTLSRADRRAMTDIRIVRVERVNLAFAPRKWTFAEERRAEVECHFDELKRRRPAVWNGRILLLHDHVCENAVFHGSCFETDFASFLAWRDWGFPDPDVRNCFGAGALRACDGAFLLGVQAEGTANAGNIYFPAGILDESDIVGETVDITGNVFREVAEETGLSSGDFEADEGWYSVFAGPRIAQVKILRAHETATTLRSRILTHLMRQPEPELADLRIVRDPADFDPMMPPFITAFLSHAWSRAP